MLNWSNLPSPANDNFANAQELSGPTGSGTGRNTTASKEGGEPNHAGNPGGASVWYSWTAPSTGNITFNTFGSDFNSVLAIYTGNAVNALNAVVSNDDAGTTQQSSVTFNVMAGTIYYIAVDGSVGVPGSVTPFMGNLTLNWFPQTSPSNDNFAQAQALSGDSGTVAGTNVGAMKENGEPNHAGDRGGRSVWYSWTATFNGPVLFTTLGSDFDTLLAVYTGASVNTLTPVASNDDSPYADNLAGHVLTSSVTNGDFIDDGLRGGGSTSTIAGVIKNSQGIGVGTIGNKNITIALSGSASRTAYTLSNGGYTFPTLTPGNYTVTPSCPSVVFSPPHRD